MAVRPVPTMDIIIDFIRRKTIRLHTIRRDTTTIYSSILWRDILGRIALCIADARKQQSYQYEK